MENQPFWRRKRLSQLSSSEWESLCDGCAKCCLLKLEDEETGRVYYTDVACWLLKLQTCRCADYQHRKAKVPGCVRLSPRNIANLKWMPKTCAYRLIAEGKDLPWWHPLVSGDQKTVHEAGRSVQGRVVKEQAVDEDDLEDRIVTWPDR